jgi:hypothetical protein
VGALARVEGGQIVVEALLAAADGHVVLRATARDASPVGAGMAVAAELLERGGRSLLDDGDTEFGNADPRNADPPNEPT